jgi:uncharacterized protein DUF6112
MRALSEAITQAALPLRLASAQDPGITPNSSGLPGLSAVKEIVGALLTFGLVACVAGFVISAAAWALGSHGGNAHYAGKGKQGCVIAGVAAILIGSANAIIRFASGIQIN